MNPDDLKALIASHLKDALPAKWVSNPDAPDTLGEALDVGCDQLVADFLNEVRDAVHVPDGAVPRLAFLAAIDADDLKELSASDLWLLERLSSEPSLPVASPDVQTILDKLFLSGSSTMENLNALATRPGSYAEAAFGPGTIIGHEDVGRLYLADRVAAAALTEDARRKDMHDSIRSRLAEDADLSAPSGWVQNGKGEWLAPSEAAQATEALTNG